MTTRKGYNMTRQFSGLPMERQIAYAEEYRDRFGATIKWGFAGDPVRVEGVPTFGSLDAETEDALQELDNRCHEEWRKMNIVTERRVR